MSFQDDAEQHVHEIKGENSQFQARGSKWHRAQVVWLMLDGSLAVQSFHWLLRPGGRKFGTFEPGP